MPLYFDAFDYLLPSLEDSPQHAATILRMDDYFDRGLGDYYRPNLVQRAYNKFEAGVHQMGAWAGGSTTSPIDLAEAEVEEQRLKERSYR